jgi:hypothetical protein
MLIMINEFTVIGNGTTEAYRPQTEESDWKIISYNSDYSKVVIKYWEPVPASTEELLI